MSKDPVEEQEIASETKAEEKATTESEATPKPTTEKADTTEPEARLESAETIANPAKPMDSESIENELLQKINTLRAKLGERDKEIQRLETELQERTTTITDMLREMDQLRTQADQSEAAQESTSKLQRRITDLEVELQQLINALKRDPKYKVYLLVRETGSRTLDELNNTLGFSGFELRRLVQELVRSKLVVLEGERISLALGHR